MNFALNEEQLEIRDSIIRFARQELAECGEGNEFPRAAWQKCAEMQLMALPFPEAYGGCGADFLTTVVATQAFGYACKDAGLVHAVCTQLLCGMQINSFGSEELKRRYLPPLMRGEKIFAQAITEAGSGSDALSMRSRAEHAADGFLLNGTKIFISNGPIADIVLVFAVTNPEVSRISGLSCLIVEKGMTGFSQCPPMAKMGLDTLQNGELVFADCAVPTENLVGSEGQGAILFNESMEWERCLLPAAHLGTLERVMETCVAYAKGRPAFGQPISKFQAVSSKIVEMKIALELGRLILYKVATSKDQHKRAALEASIAKLYISEALKQTCLDAVQIHGGYGYMQEYDVERDLRDSIAATIYSGTSEMQQNIISRFMGL
ncbi:MAG: acyl-CoA dehydrogenase family protein [Desulfuromonadales bacterium]|nr:acyl-CoA dehydrogenase family protein [Desulfuromonadales bacterium]